MGSAVIVEQESGHRRCLLLQQRDVQRVQPFLTLVQPIQVGMRSLRRPFRLWVLDAVADANSSGLVRGGRECGVLRVARFATVQGQPVLPELVPLWYGDMSLGLRVPR